ncbi:MAG: hypothetical protein JJE07_07965 [Flavobacteriaceae bacterium]|nr:hypothetical protein [Flavobacteriaceae bacterium]
MRFEKKKENREEIIEKRKYTFLAKKRNKSQEPGLNKRQKTGLLSAGICELNLRPAGKKDVTIKYGFKLPFPCL